MTRTHPDAIVAAFSNATFGREDLTEDEERFLFLLVEDRQQLGTLEADPLSDRDIALAKTWGLIGRLTRGDEMTRSERQVAGRLIASLMPEFIHKVSEKFRRLEASKRGGAAGRTVDPIEVIEIWDGLFAASGKRTWADSQTAAKKSISERQVRRIRTEFGRK